MGIKDWFVSVLEVVALVAVAVYAPELVLAGWGGAFTAGEIAYAATTAALMVGSSVLGSALQTHELRNLRDAYNAGLQDRTATRIANNAPYRFVYGRARVGSEVVAMFTSGANDEFRHLVCVHASHQCDAIEEVYINGQAMGPLDGSGNVLQGIYASGANTATVTETHSSGSVFTLAQTPIWTASNHSVVVVTGIGSNQVNVPILNVVGTVVTTGLANNTPCTVTYQVNAGGTPRVRIQKHLGVAGDAADATLISDLTAGTWPSTSTLTGFCYTVIRLDLHQPEFQNGMPAIEVLIRGKQLYDPRTSSTAWSSNPALAIMDYLTSPLCGVKLTDLPTTAFITAANVCDVASTSMPNGRYGFNGTITSDQSQVKTLEAMAQSMAGTIVATTWHIQAGTYVAPIMALLQSDIVGELAITPGISGASIYNGIKGQFVDVNNNYAVTDYVPFQNSAYRALDGIDYYSDVDYPFTNNIQGVNNLASIMLADQRNSFTIVADFSLKVWPLQVGDRVTFTSTFIGQTSSIYRITDKKYSPTSSISLTLKQDDPSIWAYATTVAQPLAPASNLPYPWAINALASITCASGDANLLIQADGTIVPRILVSWPAPTTQSVLTNGLIEVQWKPITSTSYDSLSINGASTQLYIPTVSAGVFYNVQARCVNPYLNTKSDWVVQTFQAIGRTLSASNVASMSSTLQNFGITLSWSAVTDADLASYEIRVGGAAWESAAFVMSTRATTLTLPVTTAGTIVYWIKSINTTGIYSTTAASVSSVVGLPSTTTVLTSIIGQDYLITWSSVVGAFAIDHYEIRTGASFATGTLLTQSKVTSYSQHASGGGTTNFWVSAVDVAGNFGVAAGGSLTVNIPTSVTITSQVIDNDVLLYWSDATSSLPIQKYEIRKGATWAAGTLVGDNGNGRFAALFEQSSGVFTYWVMATDTAGNTGVPASASATVNQPPDYILRNNYNSTFSGTLTNFYLANGVYLGPVNTTQTFATHFSSNSWNTINDQVNAGFPVYADPSLTTGSYEEVIDYGTSIPPTIITSTLTSSVLNGTVAVVCTISWKLNSGDAWTVLTVGSANALLPTFRYVRVHYDFNCTAGANLISFSALNIKLAIKQRNDNGSATATAGLTNGTPVTFAYPFVYADTPVVQPNGSTPLIPVVIYAGVANPTGFSVKLYNLSGTDVGGSFSWTARGY